MTTQPAAPLTLDEQLAAQEQYERIVIGQGLRMNPMEAAILASLRKLKRIEDMRGLPEPVAWMLKRKDGSGITLYNRDEVSAEIGGYGEFGDTYLGATVTPLYGPEVIELLAAEKLRADKLHGGVSLACDAANYHQKRAELAESKLAKVMEALRDYAEYLREMVKIVELNGLTDSGEHRKLAGVVELLRSVEAKL